MPRLDQPPAKETAIVRTPKTFTLRARTHAAHLRTGDYLRSKSGLTVYRIERVTKLRTAGEPTSTNRLRVTCSKATPPEASVIHPWTEAPLVPPPPKRVVPVAVPQTPEQATAVVTRLRDRRKMDAARVDGQIKDWKSNPLVPEIRTQAIIGHDGRQIRPPSAVQGIWRDPEDMNRSSRRPREIGGMVAFDPLKRMVKTSDVTPEMFHAAECLRITWETTHARPGYEPSMLPVTSATFGPSGGPSEARMIGVRAWQQVVSFVAETDPYGRKWSVIDHVVIRCQSLTTWTQAHRWHQKKSIGYLTSALEVLLGYYRHEVASLMRGDDPEIERDRQRKAR